jgi:hypothetical protein
MPIQEIHLIHHTHADFGFTDLPSTAFEFLPRYVGEALRIAAKTAAFPEAARLHFTCEVGYGVEDFLQSATLEQRTQFDALVRAGQFEVGAMPFHTTALLGDAEWQALLKRSTPLFERYAPRTCFQNDINGLPWGLIPSLKARGVKYVMMGINTYSGGVPQKPPVAFWWEGPDGSRLLTWLGFHYCAGYNFFFEGEWRVGPVPSYADVWFNSPSGREIFDDAPATLAAAHRHLQKKLAQEMEHYPHRTLGLQFTNMWRMDNDPPCEQLCHFVKAWNEAGYSPALRLSTPAKFLAQLEREAGASLPVVRGDWGEWWADGVTSMPAETALAQRTKKLLADIPRAAELLQSPADWERRLADLWRRIGLYTEHTFCSYNSLAQPYHPLTLGSWAQKANFAYQSDEDARVLQTTILREGPAYVPFSRTRGFTVLNPGHQARSGWVEISTAALRQPANAVRDLASGEVFALEEIIEPSWSAPDPKLPRPFEVPDDIFSFRSTISRFFCPPLAPGANRRFELIQTEVKKANVSASDANAEFTWQWNASKGLLSSLRHVPSAHELIAPDAPFGLGQPVFELPQGFGARETLINRKPCETVRETPRLLKWSPAWHPQGARYVSVWDHPHCLRIEQRWDFPASAGLIELTSTFWLKETLAPQAIYLAFPFHVSASEAYYYSLGHRTRVGADQMPDTCGEYQAVSDGVEFVSPKVSVALATVDTPLGCFDSIAMRNGRVSFTPDNAHFYTIVTQNYWVTNFPHTKAAKLVVRHLIHCAKGRSHDLGKLDSYLWAFPSA